VKTEEEDHIQMLDRLSLENDDDIESLIVTGDVKDVKKSFRELAKRIKAETQVAETAEEAPSQVRQAAGPIMFNGGVSGNPNNSILATSTQDRITANTPTQRAGNGNGNSRPRKKVKSTEVVVESDSDSDINIDGISDKQKENTNKHGRAEDTIDAPNALFDISMPSSLAPSAVKQRVRSRAGGRAAPRSRVGARANSNANTNDNANDNESHSTQSQLSIMDALLRKK
jgi:hypothetical protein